MTPPSLAVVLREWGRIGCVGFGGPPAHIALLRDLCVQRRRWMSDEDFEHGVAATQLLPGPGSTQMAIFCAWRLRGVPGAVVGGVAFIVPGLVLIIALSALFLGSPPAWLRGVGAGAGAVSAAVAFQAGVALLGPGLTRARSRAGAAALTPAASAAPAGAAPPGGGLSAPVVRWAAYVLLGGAATVLLGPWLVLVLLACGVVEVAARGARPAGAVSSLAVPWPLVAAAGTGGLGALAWTSFKVGALSYGGGFVIIPLMQADAVDRYGWMTSAEFLNAVALGQATPGPVVHTVAVVGYAAQGVGGALLAAVVAFAPSFWLISLGADRFDRLRTAPLPAAFLDGAGPAAVGAILGAGVLLAAALSVWWQALVLAAAVLALLPLRRGVVPTIAAAALTGAALALLGAPLP